jgi:hypothetical protein
MVFGLHMHQPVGNFDAVFQSHADQVYLPLLERLAERGALPITLHISGPLLEWMESHGHRLLDVVGRLASEGHAEILLSGFYEPVLPALSSPDRKEQIAWMREWIARRFGTEADGLWLTERVWEPDLVVDLADAGVRYTLVDDRHFLVAGFDRPDLHRPHMTESSGRSLALLPIDERLRYLIPFRPPEEVEDYLRDLRAADRPLAILADDAEKFGGWPGTAAWVWAEGWLDRFLDTMSRLTAEGTVRMVTAGGAVASVASRGPAHLPSASYREMESWSLPPAASLELERIAIRLGSGDLGGAGSGGDSFIRGGHWRGFLAKYSESRRMHAKAQLLSALCRSRGDPPEARRAIGRAQCNDVYWHGVFGGLYLRHLREANWANLARAEGLLRTGEGIAVERVDADGNGREDLWIHSDRFSCILSPADGGAVAELTWFEEEKNLADVLTRRWESYHRSSPEEEGAETAESGAPSIHDLEARLAFDELPPYDYEERMLTAERVLPEDLTPEAYARSDYDPVRSWTQASMEVRVLEKARSIAVVMRSPSPAGLEKTVVVRSNGSLKIHYRWDPVSFPPDAWFAPELSLSRDVQPTFVPAPADLWRYDIRTYSKSERGAEEAIQGISITPLWPCRLGRATIEIRRP